MRAVVLYATREGQAERVAERVARDVRARHVEADVVNVKGLRGHIDWTSYQRVFVIASVHAGRHEREIIAFATESRHELERLGAVFLSLTLSEAGAEISSATPAQRDEAHRDALQMIDVFAADTGWTPALSLPVAGALTYSKYNFLVKWIMKRIARKAGFEGDTSHDYEFTNWPAVDRFVADVLQHPTSRSSGSTGSPHTASARPA
jgi:menaquinone-dependent protoporphyrinogen oxidase